MKLSEGCGFDSCLGHDYCSFFKPIKCFLINTVVVTTAARAATSRGSVRYSMGSTLAHPSLICDAPPRPHREMPAYVIGKATSLLASKSFFTSCAQEKALPCLHRTTPRRLRRRRCFIFITRKRTRLRDRRRNRLVIGARSPPLPVARWTRQRCYSNSRETRGNARGCRPTA